MDNKQDSSVNTSYFIKDPRPGLQANIKGDIISANPAAIQLLGENPTGKSVYSFFSQLSFYSTEPITTIEEMELEKIVGDRTFSFKVKPDKEQGTLNIYGSDITDNIRDWLTNLYTKNYFHKRLDAEIARYLRNEETNRESLSVLVIDIDNFKALNDTYGHLEGDKILKEVARRTERYTRAALDIDIVARYGGEEFAVALPNTDIKEAETVSERIRKGIPATKIQGKDGEYEVKICVGVSIIDPDSPEYKIYLDKIKEEKIKKDPDLFKSVIEEIRNLLISQADQALYTAKKMPGKNRTAVYKPKRQRS